MKLLLVAFAVIAAVAADVSHLPSNEYLPPAQENYAVAAAAPSNEYLAPVQSAPVEAYAEEAAPAHVLADDGYRYKTQRRLVLRRHRRDVSHLPSNEYLPPVQQEFSVAASAPSNEYLPPVQAVAEQSQAQYYAPVEAAPAHELADDGYRYKTHRRVVLRRHRRDVSHLPSNEYLPPVQQEFSVAASAPSNEYLAPVQSAPVEAYAEEAAPAHVLADDGYRYKTQRRVVLRRHRRDVSHLPSNEYLPPVQQEFSVAASAPSNEYLPPVQAVAEQSQAQYYAPVEAAPAHELADDGYRYKTHRRVVLRRHRRDVSHLPSNEYLPPVQQEFSVAASAPSNEYLAPVQSAPVEAYAEEAAPAHVLADDGYRYKTQRRVVLRRHRRDVSHLPSNEYLPPVQQDFAVAAAAPSNEYLPPVQAVAQQSQVQYSAPVEAAPAHELADDGYRYKTQRRVVFRRRH